MNQAQDRARRAVMYLRVGGAQNATDTTIAFQRAACEHVAQRYDIAIVREYIDVGKPARWAQQTNLQHLIADLEQLQDAAYVVVSDYARLGRDLQSLNDVIRRIENCGAQVATITGVETAERFARTQLLDQVAQWATQPADDIQTIPGELPTAIADDLNDAVQIIRRGPLNSHQRAALAVLVEIAGNATLPTPVVAAVFNVVKACKKTNPNKQEGR